MKDTKDAIMILSMIIALNGLAIVLVLTAIARKL